MLGKLLKYDFRSIGRSMWPVYIATIAVSVMLSFLTRFHVESGSIFTAVLVLFVALLVGSTMGTVFLLAQRFGKGLLGNEGYLYFALPVRTSTHIASKLCNALIWGVLQMLTIGISGILMLLITEEIELNELMHDLIRVLPEIESDFWVGMLKVCLLFFLEIVALICFVYLCEAIGHLFKRHRTLWTFVAAFALMLIRARLMTMVGKEFESDLPVLCLLAVIASAVYLLATWFILDRRLNLE